MYNEIKKCRICGNTNLVPVVNLGNQFLTGVFPANRGDNITSGPLELVKCSEEQDSNTCGLLQLRHTYDLDEMYGLNYGYRSGLNKAMVLHLNLKVKKIQDMVKLDTGDLVVDIGSNDGTLLKAYQRNCLLVGIDPTGRKFIDFYPDYIYLIPEFFSSALIKEKFKNKKAKVVTSISMFYDLESPVDFMRQIYDILAEDGIWVFEQSYMPTMLEMNSYDTICHEHLEYYSLKQIKWMADKVGFKILDVEFNYVNGGSFSLTVSKKDSPYQENKKLLEKILMNEEKKGIHKISTYNEFMDRAIKHRDELVHFINNINSDNKRVFGYGASTKGNVLLQFCNFSEDSIPYIAEVNEYKFNKYTPGTFIPIISEKEAKEMKPDYFIVLPWHFKNNIIEKEKGYLSDKGKLLFPLPVIEVIDK